MKQGECKTVAIGVDDVVILEEKGNGPKVPRLTILTGRFAQEGILFPTTSVVLFGKEPVYSLYRVLHGYFVSEKNREARG